MYVSVHLSEQSRGEFDDAATTQALIDQALAADAAGVSAICLTEHHLGGFNTYCDPIVMGSYLAPQLTQAYVALHIVQVPLRHPVQIAEHCNLLDLLTKGRAMIAVAGGSERQIELDAYGLDRDQRATALGQKLDAVLAAWAWDGDPVDVATDWDRGSIGARISPSSWRKPHPLIGRATYTEATIVDCARRGWPVIFGHRSFNDDDENARLVRVYRDALESAGHSEETKRDDCLPWLGFICAPLLATTEAKAKRMQDAFIEAGGAGPIVTAANEGTQEWIEEWRVREIGRNKLAMPCTPEMLVEYLQSSAELGVDHVRVGLANTPGAHEQNQEMMQMFLEDVLPHLSPEPLPGPANVVATADPTQPTVASR